MATHIKEGKAEIVFPESNQVFYNPIQEFNRDLSIACINVWSSPFITDKANAKSKKNKHSTTAIQPTVTSEKTFQYTLFEGLAATGLRSLRYALELNQTPLITANDFDVKATDSLAINVAHNSLQHVITPSTGCCNQVLWKTIGQGKTFDCIDLDPYGSSSQFLDASIRALSPNGLLNVTCTDLAVLAGAQSEACYARYGGLPLHNTAFCHEMVSYICIGVMGRDCG